MLFILLRIGHIKRAIVLFFPRSDLQDSSLKTLPLTWLRPTSMLEYVNGIYSCDPETSGAKPFTSPSKVADQSLQIDSPKVHHDSESVGRPVRLGVSFQKLCHRMDFANVSAFLIVREVTSYNAVRVLAWIG